MSLISTVLFDLHLLFLNIIFTKYGTNDQQNIDYLSDVDTIANPTILSTS